MTLLYRWCDKTCKYITSRYTLTDIFHMLPRFVCHLLPSLCSPSTPSSTSVFSMHWIVAPVLGWVAAKSLWDVPEMLGQSPQIPPNPQQKLKMYHHQMNSINSNILPEKKTPERNDSSTCFSKQLQQKNNHVEFRDRTIFQVLKLHCYFSSLSAEDWQLSTPWCVYPRESPWTQQKRRCSFYTPKFAHVLTQKYDAKFVCSTKPVFLRLFYFELVLDTLIVSNVCWKLKEHPQGQRVRLERCD